MIAVLTNHLWQSTLFVVAAALAAMALRKNGAHVRHRIWFVASLKFLAPFSLLMSLGGALPRFTPAAATSATADVPALAIAVDQIAQPFTDEVLFSSAPAAARSATAWTPIIAGGLWTCGFLIVVVMRIRGWRRIRAAVRASVPVPIEVGVPVRASAGLLEPGVVGLFRPVLLVPAGIEHSLTPPQLEAVLAHELCHVRRRDNLTSAIHMVVESIFWFHPLVWFVGARLVDERERACDEHVLRVCGEPQVYAESILNVCKLYVESPLACVSGVGGSDLRKRIAAILVNRVGLQLNLPRKLALAIAAMLAILVPVAAGALIAPLHAAVTVVAGQASAARFDVVSIKPCDPKAPFTRRGDPPPRGFRAGGAPYQAFVSPGYMYWDCVTLAQLVDQAYADQGHPLLNIVDRPRMVVSMTGPPQPDPNQPKRVRGGPAWVETDKFTIEAKVPVDVTSPGLAGSSSKYLPALPEGMSLALRAVLEDRFKAKVHRATEQQDMYALAIATGGLNKKTMTVPVPGDCLTIAEYSAAVSAGQSPDAICGRASSSRERGMEYSSFTLQQLAHDLSTQLDHFVIDKTGVETKFNFAIKAESTPEGDGARYAGALAALGLRLELTKGPAEYLVIDSVERPRPNTPDAAPLARASGPGR